MIRTGLAASVFALGFVMSLSSAQACGGSGYKVPRTPCVLFADDVKCNGEVLNFPNLDGHVKELDLKVTQTRSRGITRVVATMDSYRETNPYGIKLVGAKMRWLQENGFNAPATDVFSLYSIYEITDEHGNRISVKVNSNRTEDGGAMRGIAEPVTKRERRSEFGMSYDIELGCG